MLFEEAARDIASQRPHLDASILIRLADDPSVPIPPMTYAMPTGREYSTPELAEWAWGLPKVVEALKKHQAIYAIKEIRLYSGAGLKASKDAYEHMLKMPQYAVNVSGWAALNGNPFF